MCVARTPSPSSRRGREHALGSFRGTRHLHVLRAATTKNRPPAPRASVSPSRSTMNRNIFLLTSSACTAILLAATTSSCLHAAQAHRTNAEADRTEAEADLTHAQAERVRTGP